MAEPRFDLRAERSLSAPSWERGRRATAAKAPRKPKATTRQPNSSSKPPRRRARQRAGSAGGVNWLRGLLQVSLGFFRVATPTTSVFLLALLSFVALANPDLNMFVPFLIFPAAFFWMVHRRGSLPIFVLFLLGIAVDALVAAPLGLTAIVLLGMHYALIRMELTVSSASAWLLWALFVAFVSGGFLLTWLMMTVLNGSLFNPAEITIRLLATVLSYPLVYMLLTPLDRLLLALDQL